MPTYEYQCPDCGHKFERFESITAEPEQTCPQCGGKSRRSIGGGVGVIFKGSGWTTRSDRSVRDSNCGHDSPCCGRDSFCEKPPCGT